MKRLESSTKKLHQETLFTAYDDVFKEWELLGIIENDPVDSSSHLHGHYLPHRPIVKQHGTTKIRPVFDASARQIGSPSLNQCLESGPNLLELIPNLPLRFREHKYGIVTDIEKAFLQISVQPEYRNVLEFFCRKTVDILLRSFYVDDLITSLDNEAEILPFIEESHHILTEGKFNLRGWKYTGDDDPEQVTSVLGLIWNRKEDELKINLDWIETYKLEIVSKRGILSVIHRVFDPDGFLCPVLLIPKLIAYTAAVFVRIEYFGVAHVNLLAAKSRIAPVKTVTIPRLELLAATVGARLCRSVLSALQSDNVKQHYWTDSTTVLSWIQREELWSVFVNSRVQAIRELTDPTSWTHFPGALNPADLPSRGCSAHQL
ncbi:integrase catalytic domain-containing protein [Trichonephila clavipes]|nr:integrase catalytic domain-containing protein [Trichonephila clavipes]